MQRVWKIYKITNTLNGKVYIGQTETTVARRWTRHCARNSHCTFLRNAIQKHGRAAFTVETVLSSLTLDYALEQERALISELKTTERECGYNLSEGGEGWTRIVCKRGHLFSEYGKMSDGMCRECHRAAGRATYHLAKTVPERAAKIQANGQRNDKKRRSQGIRKHSPEKAQIYVLRALVRRTVKTALEDFSMLVFTPYRKSQKAAYG